MSVMREMLRRMPQSSDFSALGAQVQDYAPQMLEQMMKLTAEAQPKDDGRSAEELAAEWEDCAENGCCAMLYVRGVPAGAVWGRGEEILGLAVHPQMRRRRFGTLLAAYGARVLLNGAQVCMMRLEDTRMEALQFARAAGFVQTACDAVFEL